MISRAQRIRLGVFLIVATALLLALLGYVIGAALLANVDRYEIRYDISVSGLEIGAPVKYNGVRVGRVDRIWIDPNRVSQTVVAISLQAGTPVKENTRAVLNVQGITGLRFIELVGGTSEARTLPPGADIAAGTSVVDMLTGKAEALSIKAELLINQMLQLTGDENRALVSDALDRAGSLMTSLDATMRRNAERIDTLLENVSQSSVRLSAALDELRLAAREARESVAAVRKRAEAVLDANRVAAVLDDARGTIGEARRRLGSDELGQITATLQQLLRRTDALVEKVDMMVSRSREDLRTGLRYLAETTENLRDFSRLIREDPSRLLRAQERRERVLP